MNIYLLDRNERIGYDQYDSAVVCAENEADAKSIHPDGWLNTFDANEWNKDWTSDMNKISCIMLGEACNGVNRGVLCASYNAG